jgi:adenylosuccinate synthase
MANIVVVGSQWGDEGKAKVIDFLGRRSDIIARFQGGANAGHTIKVDNKQFIFHMVPSGIMYPEKVCIVGNGVVFDAEQFVREIDELGEQGVSVRDRLFVSSLAHMVFPYHKVIDTTAEQEGHGVRIGTTGRGIGPAYSDKVSRIGIRVGDMLEQELFEQKIRQAFAQKQIIVRHAYNKEMPATADDIIETYRSLRPKIVPLIADTARMLHEAIAAGKSLLFEGAQGTFLDIDHGTYPFVTSSNTVAGAVCAGAGIGPKAIDHVVGIVKAYTTRVGNGPFPTELNGGEGVYLREKGREFGATTGRPRRCGWFDSVMVRKAVQLNSITRFAVTKLDVLDGLDEIKICTHYEINGKKQEHYPVAPRQTEQATPVYESLPGWKAAISGCTALKDLPSQALAYIERLRKLCYGVPLLLVSVGPNRAQTIEVDSV